MKEQKHLRLIFFAQMRAGEWHCENFAPGDWQKFDPVSYEYKDRIVTIVDCMEPEGILLEECSYEKIIQCSGLAMTRDKIKSLFDIEKV